MRRVWAGILQELQSPASIPKRAAKGVAHRVLYDVFGIGFMYLKIAPGWTQKQP